MPSPADTDLPPEVVPPPEVDLPPEVVRAAPSLVGQALLDNFGGRRGLLDGVVPTVVFAAVNVVAGLMPAVYGAGAIALGITGFRLIRRQSVKQALSGLVGLAIACAWAIHAHKATAFYLPGILLNASYAVAFTASLLVRWPLVAVVFGLVSHDHVGWRGRPVLRRALTAATGMWALFYAVTATVKFGLYETGHATSLAILRLALGTPAVIALGAVSYWVAKAGLRAEIRAEVKARARQSKLRGDQSAVGAAGSGVAANSSAS